MIYLILLFYLYFHINLNFLFQKYFQNYDQLKANIFRSKKTKPNKIHGVGHTSGPMKRTRQNREACGKPSCAAVMGPRYSYLLIILMTIGILTHHCDCAPVLKIKNFDVLHHHLTLRPNTRSLIPCKFAAVRPIDATKMVIEWGKISGDDGKYIPLIQLNSDGVKTFSEDGKKYELFVPLVRKGNCTLVIKPTGATDNGAYEVWMTLDGELYESFSRTRITVSGGSRALGSRAESPTTKMTPTAIKNAAAMNSKEPIGVKNSSNFFALLLEKHGKSAIIVVIAVLSFLTLTSVTSLVVCCLYCCSGDEEPSADEETPKESPPQTTQELVTCSE
ncbi:uncharacterized protein LOC101730511 [Xenopus tropicalis]|uniref:Uncharacterized protein LOC101730511 n=1 Tax=Xenopus tropicalis TaxID=8364 RepID=A0A8J1JR76_XENTR|nr:uncharacterized protein LOC101730511 [Xenopus tropicalis]